MIQNMENEKQQFLLEDWIPYKLIIEKEVPLVQWLYTGDCLFNDPFFEDSISQCKSHPFNSSSYKCISSLESIVEWASLLPPKNPTAFIFHISRCGSTLLSQLIGLDENYTVLAEVPFFDALLRLPYQLHQIDKAYCEQVLKASILMIGKGNSTSHLFIKTDSWHLFFYDALRHLYPTTSFVLLYRSPDEVLLSHQKFRGMQAVPRVIEPAVFGFTEKEMQTLSLDEYAASVLEKYLLLVEVIMKNDKLTIALNYNQGATTMIKKLGESLHINWTETHLLLMEERGRFHSKFPEKTFAKDLKPTVIADCLNNAMLAYERLENERIALL
jgi:hypothetical protein